MDNTKSNENQSTSEWRKRELGALWRKEGKSQQFYSGFVKVNKGEADEKEVRVVVFLNKMKSSEKAPDLIVYQGDEKPSGSFIDHDEIPDSFLN